MTPKKTSAAIHLLQHDVSEIKAILENRLRSMMHR